MWSYVLRTNEKGWHTSIRDQIPIIIVVQWCSDTISETTSVVKIGGLMTNSGTTSFLVGTQDIGPHEVS